MSEVAGRQQRSESLRLDAVIVGAQKCGTTTLAAMLAAHPQICLAAGKEAHLFDDPSVQRDGVDPARLEGLFAHRRPGQLLLDATPSYLYLPGCIESLVAHNPSVRAIVILRPAGERAVSHHDHERRRGVERLPLAAALMAEPFRLRRHHDPLAQTSPHRVASYLDRGRYAEQLRRLRSLIDHVHVLSLADLVESPASTFSAVQRFLGVDVLPVGEVPRLNVGTAAPSSLTRALLAAVTYREMARTAALLGRPRASLGSAAGGRR